MARKINEEEYATRRNEILDVTQRLIETRGYQQMTIQDVLVELRISKGAFYHYFDSKQALLEALIERLKQRMDQVYDPILSDPHLPALEKLSRFFAVASRIKTAQKAFVLDLLRVWYTDENAIVRQKVNTTMIREVKPQITAIICQGIQEGTLSLTYPEHASGVIMAMLQGLGDAFAEALLATEPSPGADRRIVEAVAAFTEAMERVLGAPPGSLCIVDAETLGEWIPPPPGDR